MFFRSFFLKVFFFVPAAGFAILFQLSVVSVPWSVQSAQTDRWPRALTSHFLPGAFFFATAALRGPFRVRAFVDVR